MEAAAFVHLLIFPTTDIQHIEESMPRDLDQDLYYTAPGTLHYNIKYKSGGLVGRVTPHAFEGLRSEDIDWVWIVEEKRRATPAEIRKLCKAGPTRSSST
jgi:hypothetical protein